MLRLIFSLILFYISSSICFASTFYIDPSAATNGTGTQASPYNTWRLTLQPGNTYLQKAGTNYNAQLWIGNVKGTAALPVVIDKYGSGANPIANNAYLGGDSFVTIQHFSFPNGVNIERQSTNSQITIANNDISNPGGFGVGLYIGAGTNIVASGNTVHDTLSDCVAMHTTGNTSGNGIQFLNNTVFNCGIHGLTVWTSFATVSGNIVHTTGLHGGGSSAIHVYNGCFGADPCGTEGHDNLITHNVVYDAHGNLGDGNGIQIDQMTHNNTITQNMSFSNDGEGLSLYDSANNVVSQNVFFNNGMDRNFSHSLRGNITVDASTRFFGTHGNSIVNNTAIVSNVGASAGTLGTGPFGFEVSSPAGINSYGGNKLLIANFAHASMHNYNWWNTPPIPPTQGNDIAFWNGNSNPNRVHTAPDQFGSVTISNAAGAPPMDFILPTGYQIPVLYNGAVLTLYGWRADKGLYGTFPGGAESSKGTIVPTVGPALIDSPVAVNGVVKAATSESQPKSPLIRRLAPPPGPRGHTYATNFSATENPISEGGHWINGGINRQNGNIYTTPGFAQGTPGQITYGDPVAALRGTWGPDQMVQATVYNPGPLSDAPEVEIHLRQTITRARTPGYEITHSVAGSPNGSYLAIVRWDGTPGAFTVLTWFSGPEFQVDTGDVVKATIVGNVITSYKNGVQDGQVTDNIITTGSPGIGFNFGNNGTYGFSSFQASDTGTFPALPTR